MVSNILYYRGYHTECPVTRRGARSNQLTRGYPHFIGGETESWKNLSNFSKVTVNWQHKLYSSSACLTSKPVCLKANTVWLLYFFMCFDHVLSSKPWFGWSWFLGSMWASFVLILFFSFLFFIFGHAAQHCSHSWSVLRSWVLVELAKYSHTLSFCFSFSVSFFPFSGAYLFGFVLTVTTTNSLLWEEFTWYSPSLPFFSLSLFYQSS